MNETEAHFMEIYPGRILQEHFINILYKEELRKLF